MTMNQANSIRDNWLTMLAGIVSSEKYCFTDALRVSASGLSFPVLDAEGNEIFVNVDVTIPKGTRKNGTFIPYDGYAEAKAYAEEKGLPSDFRIK